MRFEKGNKAAAKPSKNAVAALIRAKLEKESDTLSPAQFTKLATSFDRLTAKRPRRHRKEAEIEKVSRSRSALDNLPAEEQEMFREILRIEEEQLEAGRKKWREKPEAKQKEPTPTASSLPPFTHKIWTNA